MAADLRPIGAHQEKRKNSSPRRGDHSNLNRLPRTYRRDLQTVAIKANKKTLEATSLQLKVGGIPLWENRRLRCRVSLEVRHEQGFREGGARPTGKRRTKKEIPSCSEGLTERKFPNIRGSVLDGRRGPYGVVRIGKSSVPLQDR